MIKEHYKKELVVAAPMSRESAPNKKDVMKLQSWLSLYEMANPNAGTMTGIDGDFGPATELAVKKFQQASGVSATGKVNQTLFTKLVTPMQQAFEAAPSSGGLRELVVAIALHHLKSLPRELTIKGQSNSGPWVRAYMDGNEGEPWFWCMGFVQTIIDQAASALEKNFKTLMPLTYSCDTVGTTGLQKNILTRYSKLRTDPSLAKPGDIFLLQKTTHDWTHTGIIIKVGAEVFETVEGNTNDAGSSNGNGVFRRVRNFMQSKLDVFSIQPLVL